VKKRTIKRHISKLAKDHIGFRILFSQRGKKGEIISPQQIRNVFKLAEQICEKQTPQNKNNTKKITTRTTPIVRSLCHIKKSSFWRTNHGENEFKTFGMNTCSAFLPSSPHILTYLQPPVLKPNQSKVDGLAFLGLSLARASDRGHPDSITHQIAFDLNDVIDRNYEYLQSTNDDGWLVGGGEPGPPKSYKLPAKDSAHVEIMRIGTFNPEWGGISEKEIIE
jgi:hypothetical protein